MRSANDWCMLGLSWLLYLADVGLDLWLAEVLRPCLDPLPEAQQRSFEVILSFDMMPGV